MSLPYKSHKLKSQRFIFWLNASARICRNTNLRPVKIYTSNCQKQITTALKLTKKTVQKIKRMQNDDGGWKSEQCSMTRRIKAVFSWDLLTFIKKYGCTYWKLLKLKIFAPLISSSSELEIIYDCFINHFYKCVLFKFN